jgi:hypothetical protein
MNPIIRPLDIASLREQFRTAKPFPFFAIDDFLDEAFVADVVAAYPTYEQARQMGREFSAVNERLKVDVSDSSRFPPPVKRLSDALASAEFLAALEQITGIKSLLADASLVGGGMHLTGPTGRLDVHVDFNYVEDRKLHRRLNILVYLNPGWQDAWGGAVELWDRDVKNCVHSYQPILNRCVVFATSEISFHGVSPNRCPPGQARKSFAAYYYTKEAPEGWDGLAHGTVFRARPNEAVRNSILVPAERARRSLKGGLGRVKGLVKRLLGK